jgi:hypothetical protein
MMILLLFVLCGEAAFGQGGAAQDTLDESIPRLAIKNGTTTLLDPVLPSVNFGLEYYFTDRYSVYLEGGPVLKVRYFTDDPEFNELSGYRIRMALRHFLQPIRMSNKNVAYYVELFGSYYQINGNIAADFRRTTSIGSFSQRLDYELERSRMGGYLNFGFQSISRSGFLLEMGIGAGVLRRANRYGGDIPEDAVFLTNGTNLSFFDYQPFDPEPSWIASVLFYLNLGFTFD